MFSSLVELQFYVADEEEENEHLLPAVVSDQRRRREGCAKITMIPGIAVPFNKQTRGVYFMTITAYTILLEVLGPSGFRLLDGGPSGRLWEDHLGE